MRQQDECPACGGQTGRVDPAEQAGVSVLIYWHTDLSDEKEFCVEYPCGETEEYHLYSVKSNKVSAD